MFLTTSGPGRTGSVDGLREKRCARLTDPRQGIGHSDERTRQWSTARRLVRSVVNMLEL